jgi:uncharacterized protein YdiU (UPF0061 family)
MAQNDFQAGADSREGSPADAQRTPATAGGWRLDHSYARLPTGLWAEVLPSPVRAPQLVAFNRRLALELGLDADSLAGADGAAIFAGNQLPLGAKPLAQTYSGHQYGHFTTLGDGRAILLGEQLSPSGARWDIQLKGAGPTPYSRRGDGRAALGPMLREYIISEAMAALGIPTTRSLAVAATGEPVWRSEARPGAVLTRVAASHLRVGTLAGAAARGDLAELGALVDYTLQRHYPEQAGSPNPALALLNAVVARQAELVARWMLVGFVHGVLNTDNVALSGETIDYGPCAFMDAYDPATVFSSIDRHGRYAYGHQPKITQWNLSRLAEALLPLLDPEEERAVALAQASLGEFAERYQQHWVAGMRGKLGLFNAEPEDAALAESLLLWMQTTKADYTNTFAALAEATADNDLGGLAISGARADAELSAWMVRWRQRLARQEQTEAESVRLRQANSPAVIARNHRVEAALAAAERGDLSVMERLLAVLSSPYDYAGADQAAREPGPQGEEAYRTFCGT